MKISLSLEIFGYQKIRSMGDLQDPKNRGTVPYFWPYFGGISPYIGLIYGRYLQSIGS